MGENIQLPVPLISKENYLEKDVIILPCRPSSPNYTVTLEKQNDRRNDEGKMVKFWDSTPLTSGLVHFDPKIGFLMKKNFSVEDQPYNIIGLYKCSVANFTFVEEVYNHDEEYLDHNTDDSDTNKEDHGYLNSDLDPDKGNVQKRKDDIHKNVHTNDLDIHSVYINVTQTSKLPVTTRAFQTTLQLSGNGSVGYNKHQFGKNPPSWEKIVSSTEIMCCSGEEDKVTWVFTETGDDPIQRQIGMPIIAKSMQDPLHPPKEDHYCRDRHVREDCSRIHVYENLLVTCIGDNVKFVEFFINVFKPDLMHVSKRAFWRFQQEEPVIRSFKIYAPESYVSTAPLSQKMVILLGHYVSNEELIRNRFQYEPIEGLHLPNMHWSSGNDTYPEDGHPDSDDPVSLEYQKYEQFGLLYDDALGMKIEEYPRDVYYEGEPLVAVCLGWRNMYSEGGHMRILWRNGSRTDLNGAGLFPVGDTIFYFSGILEASRSEGELLNQIGPQIIASKEMKAIECWMPQWNTTVWDKMTKELTILEPIVPQFVQGVGNVTEETIYYYLDEETPSKELECILVRSAPVARINVTKDGVGVMHPLQGIYDPQIKDEEYNSTAKFVEVKAVPNGEVNNNGNIRAIDDGRITLNIVFSEITKEIEGVYQCIAENIKGTVTRTIRVVVLNSRN